MQDNSSEDDIWKDEPDVDFDIESLKFSAYSIIYSVSAMFIAPRIASFVLQKLGVEVDRFLC